MDGLVDAMMTIVAASAHGTPEERLERARRRENQRLWDLQLRYAAERGELEDCQIEFLELVRDSTRPMRYSGVFMIAGVGQYDNVGRPLLDNGYFDRIKGKRSDILKLSEKAKVVLGRLGKAA